MAGFRGTAILVAIALCAGVFVGPLPAAASAAEAPVGVSCEGDECQGPPPVPEDPTPGTAVVVGPANPPVRWPKPRSGKHKKKHPAKKRHQQRRVAR
jgi:hypothetical protein